jgi:hypothetical protein
MNCRAAQYTTIHTAAHSTQQYIQQPTVHNNTYSSPQCTAIHTAAHSTQQYIPQPTVHSNTYSSPQYTENTIPNTRAVAIRTEKMKQKQSIEDEIK